MRPDRFAAVFVLLALVPLGATAQSTPPPWVNGCSYTVLPPSSFDDPDMNIEICDGGLFENYYYRDYPHPQHPYDLRVHMLFFAYVPKNVPLNQAGLVFVRSGEFVSGDRIPGAYNSGICSKLVNFANPFAAATSPDLVSAARPFVKRGYVMFALTHGSILRDPEGGDFVPGWILPEIFSQLHHEVRVIRTYASHFGIDENQLAVVGGSSAGGCAQSLWLENLAPDPSASYFDPAIDAKSSRINVCAVTSTGCDASNWRGTGNSGDPIDNSYLWRKPQFWVHPDLSGLPDPARPYYGLPAGNYPVPTLPPELTQYDTGGCCNGIYNYASGTSFYVDNLGHSAYDVWPELAFNAAAGGVGMWWLPVYQYALSPNPFFCPAFVSYMQRYSSFYRLVPANAPYGPIHWVNGEADQIVVVSQAQRMQQQVAAYNTTNPQTPINLDFHTFAGEGHTWRDLDAEVPADTARFIEHQLLNAGKVDYDQDGVLANVDPDDNSRDTDGDGQPDGAELKARTSPTDPKDVFCITNCTATLSTAPATISLTFRAGASLNYVLQSANTLGDVDLDAPSAVWTDEPGITPVISGATGTFTFQPTGLVPASAAGGPPSPQTRRFYRVRLAPLASGGIVATAPVAVLHGIIARQGSGGTSLSNYLSAPVHRPDVVQARLEVINAEKWFLRSGPSGSPLAGLQLGSGRHIAIVVEDGLRAAAPLQYGPEDRGAEGRWWVIADNSDDAVKLITRPSLPAPMSETSVPLGSAIAIRPLSSLADVLGPGADTGNVGSAEFYPKSGDVVWLYQSALGTLGTRARYKYGTTAATPTMHWYQTATTQISGAYALLDDTPNFSQVMVMPDEAVGYTAVPNTTGDDSYRILTGFVPMSDLVAYLEAPAAGSATSAHQREEKGWPFPQDALATSRFGTTSRFLSSGLIRDPGANHYKSDRITIGEPLTTAFVGDSVTSAARYTAEPDTATAHDPLHYWDVPYEEVWYSCSTSNVETLLADAARDALHLTWSRGYTIEVGTNHTGTIEWHLRRPYMRPLEW